MLTYFGDVSLFLSPVMSAKEFHVLRRFKSKFLLFPFNVVPLDPKLTPVAMVPSKNSFVGS
jgi:hypothetical protein